MATTQRQLSWTKPSDIERLYIEKHNGRGDHLSGGFLKFEYFESILSPFTTANLTFLDSGFSGRATNQTDIQERRGTVSSTLPITGNESLEISLAHISGGLNYTDDDRKFIVDSFTTYREQQKEVCSLRLVSNFGVKNRSVRVGKKYQNNIRNSLYSILNNELGIPSTLLDLQGTQNSQEFLGSNRSPFELALYLGKRSRPVTGAPGYVFYQTQSGFHFKSLDTLVNQSEVDHYSAKDVNAGEANEHSSCRIIKYVVIRNQDLSATQDIGVFNNRLSTFDPLSQSFVETEFNVSDNSNFNWSTDFSTLGTEKFPELALSTYGVDWNSNNTDLDLATTFSIMDRGNNSTLPSIPGVTTVSEECQGILSEINNDPLFHQALAIMRYNSIFMQVIDMIIPCNLYLKAGMVITCEFPLITGDNVAGTSDNEWESGRYLILHLSHQFTNEGQMGSLTHLRVVRDTHGLYSTGSTT